MNVSLLAEAKKQRQRKISNQFISFYDSVLYLGEPTKEALEFVIDNLCNNQTHLKLDYDELYLISIKRYQDDEDEHYYFTSDYIEKHLIECVNQNFIDAKSPLYNLGFAKKSYIEMLICYSLSITEAEQLNTQSPDLAFDNDYFEVDYHTFEMIVADRDELRDRLEKQQVLISKLQNENEQIKAALEAKHTCEPVEQQGYLDPNNKCFSIEMKLCHDTWNYLYENGNNSHLAHSKQVSNYLESYADLTVNTKAIERITTITNPKAMLAGTTTNTDI